MRTVVVKPSGKIQAILPSNDWQLEDLIREIRAAASVEQSQQNP